MHLRRIIVNKLLRRLEIANSNQAHVASMTPAERNEWFRNKAVISGVDVSFLRTVFVEFPQRIRGALEICEKSKTILFSQKQAKIFSDIGKRYSNSLEFMLPFAEVMLCFDAPVPVEGHKIVGIVMRQGVMDERLQGMLYETISLGEKAGLVKRPAMREPEIGEIFNDIYAIDGENWMPLHQVWWQNGFPISFNGKTDNFDDNIKNLAIACIGYINCENIYLYKEGEVPEVVNAKRERKGKTRLEPYYTCRIRGVIYDGPVNEGSGVEHGFRYDVRGHFRRMDSGKTTWVRPHQRGLKHELYIPKVYTVDKVTA